MSTPLYSVAVWHPDTECYELPLLPLPSQNVDWRGLLNVLRALRLWGYECHRRRDADGSYDMSNDSNILVVRTDGLQLDGQR